MSKRINAQMQAAIARFLREINFAASDVSEWRTTRTRAFAGVSISNVTRSKSFEEATMNERKRLSLLILLIATGIFWSANAEQKGASQESKPSYKSNNCVGCHSQLLEPLGVSNRYLEWQLSRHEEKGVSCEKCHGGDPSAKEKERAHAGVLQSSNPQSRLHWKNLPETCNACHQTVVGAFVQSAHYQRLKGIGLGPSCNTCHAHMATEVVYSPAETANLCAQCHDAINFIRPRPEIPARAKETMMSLQRADAVINWALLLLAEGRKRNQPLDAQGNELRLAEETLGEAKVKWHEFNLETVRKQADESYFKGAKVKDGLRKKLGVE
jgi:nitrate/TMAO reductase-like tetraheme cytochrome c subunit